MLLSKVDEIELWKDPGYMLGGVEIPGLGYSDGSDLGTPDEDMVLDRPLLPDRFTNHYEIKVDGMIGDDVTCYRYMRLHVPQENADDFLLYCWITDVIRNAATAPACIIRYEIDYWRTYLANLTFGRGTVTRCSDPTYRRPRPLQPRYRTVTNIKPLNGESASVPDGAGKDTLWVYVLYNHTQPRDPDNPSAGSVTSIRNLYFPTAFNIVSNGTFYVGNTAKMTMPLNAVYYGRLDEVFGIDPDSIIGAWLSPICPGRGVTWDDENSRWTLGLGGTVIDGATFSGISDNNLYVYANETEIAFSPAIGTDDTKTYVITDMQGNIAGSLPYGVEFSKIRILTDINSSGGYLIVYGVSDDLYADYTPTDIGFNRAKGASLKLAAAAGCAWTIPLMQLPIGSNAWSSYVYSGQRDYDIESARLSREQQAINGITGALGGAVSGALTGALVGSAGGPIGAVGGAAIGAGTQLAGVGINYAVSGYFNDRLQDSKDALYANQSSQLLLPGGSALYVACCEISATVKTGFGSLLLELSADSVSAQEIADDISLNGYETQIPVPDVTSFVNAGGPLRIENMTIGGEDVPYRAIAAIKDMFLRGVYIINPPEEEGP